MKKIVLVLTLIVCVASISNAQITSAGVKGLWGDAACWVGGKVPTTTDDVVIAAGDSVTFSGATAACKNLTINGVLQFSKSTTVALTVNGNILVNSTGGVRVQSNGNPAPAGEFIHTLDLKGNLTHNGTLFDFRTGTSGTTLAVCNTTLSGTTNSTITMNGTFSQSNGEFNAVTINKSGTGKVLLGNNMYLAGGSSTGPQTANSTLTFVNGIVETGNFALVALTTTAAQVVGYSNASYVIGAMGRGMSSSAASNKVFPVGDAKGLRPFTLYSSTSGTATGNHGIVRCIAGNANTGSSTFAGGIDKVSAVRYYQISYNWVQGSTTNAATSMGFNNFKPSYGTDDGVTANSNNVRVAYSTDRAVWTGLVQTTPDTVRFQTPPKQVSTPDPLATAITLNAGTTVMYAALARAIGSTDNPLTDIQIEEGIPTKYELTQNYPNPFNPSTIINYQIPVGGIVKLKIYDVLGSEVEQIVNGYQQAGNYKVTYNASKLSSGVYFYSLEANNVKMTKKMLLVR